MPTRSLLHGRVGAGAVAILIVALLAVLTISHARTPNAHASGSSLLQLSSDPYTNTSSQHKTEVEPDSFANGSTIVTAFQAGRFSDGGSSNIGWATSINGGATWTSGFLPGITRYAGGTWERVSDPSVAYDSTHQVWIIASLTLGSTVPNAVIVSRSTDGGLTWSSPVTVSIASGTAHYDKDWIVCDNWPHRNIAQSIYTGRCYVEWDDANSSANNVRMSTSTDGGRTWSSPNGPSSINFGIGGQPLVQPNGHIVVPIIDGPDIAAFTSSNGGQSWSAVHDITPIEAVIDGGNIRGGVLPSAEVDANGVVYVVWSDARFEPGNNANDIVMTTSADGGTWSPVQRIPIDPTSISAVDHLLAGIAVDKGTSGSSVHLGLMYYYVPQGTNCTVATCQLDVGFVSSTNGGSTWSAPAQLAGPMNEAWLANTDQGYMVGDYFSASFVGGKCFPVFSVAGPPPSSGVLNQAMYTWTGGLAILGGTRSGADSRVYRAPRRGASIVMPRTAN
ncbi:MAG TPA: sialidase family protein [Ktedonobacterales bacterium]|nr:sialidase family protein [Ktedonobacterales bacterium]